jgi:hypothetical protein
MKPETPVVVAMMVSSLSPAAMAGEREDLLTLKNTTLNLIELLVQQGVLDKNKAQQLVQAAEQKAAAEAKQQMAEEAKAQAGEAAKSARPKNDKSVRVAYVPDFIKDEIRQQVRAELKDDVVKEVKAHAKDEKWGVPAALPDWVNRFKLTGDVRLRGEGDYFPSSNPANDLIDEDEGRFQTAPRSYANWQAVNNGASIDDRLSSQSNAFLNTSEDVKRFRMRLRLGLEAQIAEGLKAGVRLATSNSRSPVSTNQTLGQTGQQYEFVLDRGFLQYDYIDGKGTDWLTLWAGRTINPWLSTDNLFDSDLGFEGLSGTVRLPFGTATKYTPPPPNARYGTNMGYSQPDSLFLTSGVYPLEEFQLSSNDKWLWGSQLGLDLLFRDSDRLKFGLAYYDYHNIEAQPNTPLLNEVGDRGDRNYTAPQFMQKGNTLMQINTTGAISSENPNLPRRVGLASGFSILNAVAVYDYAGFGDNHVILTADYAKNVGFDGKDILRRAAPLGGVAGIVNYGNIRDHTNAWQVRLDVGRPEIKKLHDWNMTFAYKYLERDAVLDAYTDSDFHLGGTNAKGWVFGASYGIAHNTWLNARWMTADQIEGPKYGVDVLMVDLNSRF